MADTMPIKCPECEKAMNVPLTVAGKKIKCKECATVFEVPKAKPKPPQAAAPVAEKPADKPAEPAKPKSPWDDEDDGPNSYGATKDDSDIPRCPFCTYELDPPDTRICLTCGYDLVERRRHESKKVFAHTKKDYFKHHILTIVCALVVIATIAILVVSYMKMADMLRYLELENDQEDPVTKKKGWIIPPGACLTPMTVIGLGLIYRCGSFVFKRLVYNFKPTEKIKGKK
jgi:hypothetical protein